MSSEIERLRIEIRSRKFDAMELSTQISNKVREIRGLLPVLAKIEDMELDLVAKIAAEAASLKARYLTLQGEIDLLSKELG